MKNLRKYLQGKRIGKEAHQIEVQAMKDPFLEDALEGYDLFNDNPIKAIDRLHNNIRKRFQTSIRISLKIWMLAASILLCIGLGVYGWKMFRPDGSKEVAEAVHSADKHEISAETEPLSELPVSPPEIQWQATDTLTIYQPKDKERIEAARLAEIIRWKEEQRKLREQQLKTDSLNTLALPDTKAQSEDVAQPSVSPTPQNGTTVPKDSI